MAVVVTVQLDIQRASKDIQAFIMGEVEHDVRRRTEAVQTEVKRLIIERADEPSFSPGGLAGSVLSEVFVDGPADVSGIVYSNNEHALWFEEGTGMHGPRHVWIIPRKNFPMVFQHRQLGRKVYAWRVQGYPGRHPFRDGIQAASGGPALPLPRRPRGFFR